MKQPGNPMQRSLRPRGVIIVLLWTLWPIIYLVVYAWAYAWEFRYNPLGGIVSALVSFKVLFIPLLVTGWFWWQAKQSGGGESLLFADPPRRDPWSVAPGGAVSPVLKAAPAVATPPESAVGLPARKEASRPPSWLEQLADLLLNQDPVRLLHALAGTLTAFLLGVIVLAQLLS